MQGIMGLSSFGVKHSGPKHVMFEGRVLNLRAASPVTWRDLQFLRDRRDPDRFSVTKRPAAKVTKGDTNRDTLMSHAALQDVR